MQQKRTGQNGSTIGTTASNRPTRSASVFAESEWLDAWLAAFAPMHGGYWGNGPSFPYMLTVTQLGPLSIRTLQAPANSHTPRFDLPGVPLTAVAAAMRSLHTSYAVFPFLAEDADLLRHAAHDRGGLMLRRVPCEIAPYIACDGDWDGYFASRSSKTRQEWRRRQRRAAEIGFELTECRTSETIERHFPTALEVEASGWKGAAGSAIREDAPALAFYTSVVPKLAARGLVRLYLWRIEGRTAAFQLCIVDGDALRSLKIGFDPEFARHAPGQMLQLAILRELFQEDGIRRFDLLGPDTPPKRMWATGSEMLWTLHCYRPTLAGMAMALRHGAAAMAKAWAARIARR
ncbi:MAG: GNAT family N-acetyltransferase [Nitrococcus mobilis]|nr:GNAT family N-acetyltransferase [Nitrococcus mobilis]